MIPLQITLNIEKNPWSDVPEIREHGLGTITRIGRLTRGTVSGGSTVSVIIEMPDGKRHAAQTTMALFMNAANVLRIAEEEGL